MNRVFPVFRRESLVLVNLLILRGDSRRKGPFQQISAEKRRFCGGGMSFGGKAEDRKFGGKALSDEGLRGRMTFRSPNGKAEDRSGYWLRVLSETRGKRGHQPMVSLRDSRMRTRDLAIAIGLIRGLSAEAACLCAGYSRTTARKDAWRIVRRPGVRQALLDLGLGPVREYSPRLASQLEDPNIDLGLLIQCLRFVVHELGAVDSLNQEASSPESKIPEIARELIAKRVQELLVDKNSEQ